jgi:hypothetical protein
MFVERHSISPCNIILTWQTSAMDLRSTNKMLIFSVLFLIVRQMPAYNSQTRDTDRTCPFFFSFYCYVCPFSVFCVRFVCKCVLYSCHRVSTQLRLYIYIYHIISYKQFQTLQLHITIKNQVQCSLQYVFLQCHKRRVL